jgi:hypothetical protein
MWHICYYFGCNYYIRTNVIIFIYWDYLVSSDLSLSKKNYIPLLIYNSDELVMSRGNQKIFTYAFCKSRALQSALIIIPIVLAFDPPCKNSHAKTRMRLQLSPQSHAVVKWVNSPWPQWNTALFKSTLSNQMMTVI